MTIRATCVLCGRKYRFADENTGRRFRRKWEGCGNVLTIGSHALPSRMRTLKQHRSNPRLVNVRMEQNETAGRSITMIAAGVVLAVAILAGILFMVGRTSPGTVESSVSTRRVSREQIKFIADSDLARSRTTSEWFALLIEKRTTKSPARKAMLSIRMPNPESFLGPDPAALPEVLAALNESGQQWGPSIAQTFKGIGVTAPKAMMPHFANADPEAKSIAVDVFHSLSAVDAVPLLVTFISQVSGPLHEKTCTALRELMTKTQPTSEQLVSVFEFATPAVQAWVLEEIVADRALVQQQRTLLQKKQVEFQTQADQAAREALNHEDRGVTTKIFRSGSRNRDAEQRHSEWKSAAAGQARRREVTYRKLITRIDQIPGGSG